MSKTITLNLRKDLIFEAVKAESYDTGRINKATDPVKNAPIGMQEQAGGEQHQERQLLRFLKQAIAKFEAQMGEFLDSQSGSVSNTLSDSSDSFVITMVINDRFNNGMATPIASLCEDFLVNQMLFTWWNGRDQNFSKTFVLMAQDDIEQVRLCMIKTAPTASAADYTDVTGNITGGGIVSIAFPLPSYNATMGQAFTSPLPTTAPSGLALTYSSSNSAVATVDASGTVTLVGAGTAVITAHFGGNSNYSPASGSYTLTVNPA